MPRHPFLSRVYQLVNSHIPNFIPSGFCLLVIFFSLQNASFSQEFRSTRPNCFQIQSFQAGSTTDIDNLVVTDLDLGKEVYSNNFSTSESATQSLNLFYYPDADDDYPHHTIKTGYVLNGSMTRVVSGKLRLETTGFNSNGAGGYNSHSEAVYTGELPRNFKIEFEAVRLQWAGHFGFGLFRKETTDAMANYLSGGAFSGGRISANRQDIASLSASGSWFNQSAYYTDWINRLNIKPVVTFPAPSGSLYGSSGKMGISLNNNTLTFFLNGNNIGSSDISFWIQEAPTITSTNSFRGTVGVTFSNAVTATGTTPITYSGSNLPSGLIITTNGSITGKPLVAGTNYTLLTAMNAYGTNRQTNTFIIAKGTPTVSNWPTASEITYGQSLSNSVLSGGSASVTGSFAWTYPTYKPNAGSNSQSVTFAPTATNNYVSVSTNIFIAVNKATPVLTWTPSPAAYLTYPAPLTSTQLNATSSVAGTFIYNPSAGTILNVGTNTLVATFTPSNTTNYVSGGKISNTVVVSKGTPIITVAPVASPIVAGQALSNSVLAGGSATVGGTFSFTSPSFVPPVGVSIQPVIFNPTDAVNYNTAQTNISVTVLPVPVREDVLYGTMAGLAGNPGNTDGSGSVAKFNSPRGLTVDGNGYVYVADTQNSAIRKISPDGAVTTLVGPSAGLNRPWAVSVSAQGEVYVADTENHAIRKISASGQMITLAGSSGTAGWQDGTGEVARFNRPMGIAVDPSGNVYVADTGNHTIRKISPEGLVTRVAGQARFAGYADGRVADSMLNTPMGLVVVPDGSLWVADANNFVLRKLVDGVLTTVAGVGGQGGFLDGQGSAARLAGPVGLTTDLLGNVYFSEMNTQYIRKCTSDGRVSLWAGRPRSFGVQDGSYDEVKFYYPAGLAMDAMGNLYVADSGNNIIRLGRATPKNLVLASLQLRPLMESILPQPVAEVTIQGDPTGVAMAVSTGFEVRPTADPMKFEVWTSGPCDYEATLFVTFQVSLSRSGGTPTTLSGLLVMQDDRSEDADGDGLVQSEEQDIYGTSDLRKDTDGDGVNDPMEIADGTNPKDATSYKSLSLGLVAYYPFNGNAKDASGNGNDASVVGASLTTDRGGVANAAYSFNGGGNYIQLPGNRFLDNSVKVTISAWYRFQGNQSGQIFASGDTRPGYDPYSMRIGPGGFEDLSVADTSAYRTIKANGSLDYRDGVWRHIVMVLKELDSSTSQLLVYLDGCLVTTTNMSPKLTIRYDTDMVSQIGAIHSIQFWKGQLDDFRFYNRDLSATDVAQLYQQEAGNLDSDGDGLTDTWERGYGRYEKIRGLIAWDNAKEDALLRGGHLLTITSAAEYGQIASALGPNFGNQEAWWIGATDWEEEGAWKWVTGERWSYSPWSPQEPNGGSTENYAHIQYWDPYGWNDAPGSAGMGYTVGYILERGYPTDPTKADTDGDRFDDKVESLAGTDPNDARVYPNPGWDFSCGFKHINETGAESYLVSTSNVRKYSEWQSPPLTYWGPTANGVDGALTYRFPASQPIRAARLKASIESFNFPWPGYFGSGKGWSSIWGSKNGSDWILLLDNPRPTDNVGRGMAYDQQLPGALLGGTDLWIQVRLRVTEAPNSSYTTAQFGRGNSANSQRIFELKLDYDGVFPENSQASVGFAASALPEDPAARYALGLDSDGDGQSDAAELVAGTDPYDAKSLFALTLANGSSVHTQSVTGNGSGTVALTLTWTSVPGKNYVVEASSDLTNWAMVATVSAAAGQNSTSYQVYAGGERAFYRVSVLAE